MIFLKYIPTKFLGVSLIAINLIACGFQSYSAKPINPIENKSRFDQQNPKSEEFREYLIAQGFNPNSFPIQVWGLNELTYSALFFHSDLDLARKEWRAAQSAEITAAQRIDPSISAASGKNTIKNPEETPWTYDLGIDIGIITAGKREARIDRASNLSEAAKIKIAQTAWQVRTRLAKSLIEYEFSLEQSKTLQKEVDLRSSIVDMLQKRLDAGMASSTELNNARISLQKSEQTLAAEQIRTPSLLAALASDAGLSLDVFKTLNLSSSLLSADSSLNIIIEDSLQETAMLNRLDLRASLARYQAAEAKLRLEIARQYPDITLSPSYSYEPDGKFWNLGVGSLITLLNKNKGLIAEANSLRDVEAAQFNVVQTRIISEINQSKASYTKSFEAIARAEKLLESQSVRMKQIEQQFNSGAADRLQLTNTELENIIALQNQVLSRYKFRMAKIALEDSLQKPLDANIKIENASTKD